MTYIKPCNNKYNIPLTETETPYCDVDTRIVCCFHCNRLRKCAIRWKRKQKKDCLISTYCEKEGKEKVCSASFKLYLSEHDLQKLEIVQFT